MLERLLSVNDAVRAALGSGKAVVALESALISHGLPWPDNMHAVERMCDAIRAEGAQPAVCAVMDGRIRIGLDKSEIEALAKGDAVCKVSSRDLAALLARRHSGATTAAATMRCAMLAGVRVVATGGIGGVHKDFTQTMDVSADLIELSRTPVTVVCSGAKSILDLPRTLEMLESLAIPVIGYKTTSFPAFYVRESGLALDTRVDSVSELTETVVLCAALNSGGTLVVSPIPRDAALDGNDVDEWTKRALNDATQAGTRGSAVTPFILQRLAHYSRGRSINANIALLESNARLAAELAVDVSARAGDQT